MCQLLGMNANVPTDICFSFQGFRQRGGRTDHHADGWGIGFFEEGGCRVFLDTQPSITSPIATFVSDYPIRSCQVIAHIRKATQGVIRLPNTHPFQRELNGQVWLFAHNGDLPCVPATSGPYRPIGDTDSEAAFCYLLNTLRHTHGDGPMEDALVFEHSARVATELGQQGTFNFLLSNGDWLLAHCSTSLSTITRQAPFSVAQLADDEVCVDFREHTGPDDQVVIIATAPLTENEVWTTVRPGTLLMYRNGALLRSAPTAQPPVRDSDATPNR